QQWHLRCVFLQRELDLRDLVRFIHRGLRISERAWRQGRVAFVAAGSTAVDAEILAGTFGRADRVADHPWLSRSDDAERAGHRVLQIRDRSAGCGRSSLGAAKPAGASTSRAEPRSRGLLRAVLRRL